MLELLGRTVHAQVFSSIRIDRELCSAKATVALGMSGSWAAAAQETKTCNTCDEAQRAK